MSGYWEVTVVVDGALDVEAVLLTDEALDDMVAAVRAAATADGKPTEMFTLWHEHPMYTEDDSEAYIEDTCIQYATDLRPAFTWNMEEDDE